MTVDNRRSRKKSRPGRIPCCVPFCGRTALQERHPGATEIICGQHWRMAPDGKRRVYRRAWRAWTKAAARQIRPGAYASGADLQAAMRAGRRVDRLWHWMKREVIQMAVGIGRAA